MTWVLYMAAGISGAVLISCRWLDAPAPSQTPVVTAVLFVGACVCDRMDRMLGR